MADFALTHRGVQKRAPRRLFDGPCTLRRSAFSSSEVDEAVPAEGVAIDSFVFDSFTAFDVCGTPKREEAFRSGVDSSGARP